MRSLNMAHHACQLPANQDTRHFDYGRQVALWVSAFEILAHPQTEQVDKRFVCDLLDRAHWTQAQGSTKKTHGERNPDGWRGIPSWLYLRLYDARNNYLHGNPVSPESLRLPGTDRVVADFAAPLYRIALTAFLGLRPPDVESLAPDSPELKQALVENVVWGLDSQDFEKAILMSRGLAST